ncbi:DUF3618 domain-containing protein [Actinoplanes utahensis]|uniref:DUF3618 domain-containing protein n=1 Tax=Actinoplanes utahensis TaxID=1869 RepID=A0A0A6X7K9_ACTUT|nr:DUF3618 domain-containing protein [Actinoplanes utahensis]KHD76117.1 hypothetical protein MB27_18405 [Actinoplanes utahensis]GIF28619.1 hypothetical protein Aut01nite_16050 [Actinoplanes utahensis]
MTDDNVNAGNNGNAAKPDLTALRADIQQTRAELGETVQVLAARADVKARAREQVEETKQRAREQVEETKQRVLTRAATVTGRVREAALGATGHVRETPPRELALEAGSRVRANPFPLVLAFAGIAAVAGVILIMRGRR